MFKHAAAVLLMIALQQVVTRAQPPNTIGLPHVINFTRQEYRGGLQNWEICQDAEGWIYIANNEGLLCFDGNYWQLYPLPNNTIVRSVAADVSGRIYVGGQDELGYFTPGKNGNLIYHSLLSLLPPKERSFGDVWDIVIRNKDVFFRTEQKIIRINGSNAFIYPAPMEWAFLGMCNGTIYAHDFKNGLLRYAQQVWEPVQKINTLPPNDPVTAVMPLDNHTLLLTTLKNGLFFLKDDGKLTRHPTGNNRFFAEERIYAATALDSGWYALATNNSGVYIIDVQGNIIQHFSKTEALQNNNVLSIFLDRQKNLWLGLDNGIDFIAYNSAIKHITPLMQDGSGYAACLFQNRLYLGTSNGLFSVPLENRTDLSFSKGKFEPVQNARGQAWVLANINQQLLLGHHDGAFVVDGNQAKPLITDHGYWNFIPLSNVLPTDTVAAGNYRGIQLLRYNGKGFVPDVAIPHFDESSRYLCIDALGHFWVSHPYHGVFRIRRQGSHYTIDTYTRANGLPSTLNNHVFNIHNTIVAGTAQGVYGFNTATQRFEPSAYFRPLLGEKSIRYLREDKEGNIWFIFDKSLGVIDITGKKPRIIYLPELNNKMLSGFEFIYPVDEHNIFLGGEKGFYHINYAKYKKNVPALQASIRRVLVRQNRDSILYGGFKMSNDEKPATPSIHSKFKTIQFQFSSSLYGYQSNLEYSYRLKGFDEQWSEWSSRTEKEYTNLSEGTYTFEVKVRNNLGNESATDSFTFTVMPPWYRTLWAKMLYVLLFVAGLFQLYRWQQKRFNRQMQKMEEEQQKLRYIHELERSKTEGELAALRNAKLEAEINFKNSEMASTAMHLLKKGELLSKIKAELTQIMKRMQDEQAITEIRKMIKSLNEDENIDQEWENFSKHFDKVHGDFVVTLKNIHPNLTNNELKLCTYLRMNLSTKEIAQLMNISVRGVEISRYRLRKKLGIPSEVSLFDYLIRIKEAESNGNAGNGHTSAPYTRYG